MTACNLTPENVRFLLQHPGELERIVEHCLTTGCEVCGRVLSESGDWKSSCTDPRLGLLVSRGLAQGGPDTWKRSPLRPQIEAHLGTCAECGEELAEHLRFMSEVAPSLDSEDEAWVKKVSATLTEPATACPRCRELIRGVGSDSERRREADRLLAAYHRDRDVVLDDLECEERDLRRALRSLGERGNRLAFVIPLAAAACLAFMALTLGPPEQTTRGLPSGLPWLRLGAVVVMGVSMIALAGYFLLRGKRVSLFVLGILGMAGTIYAITVMESVVFRPQSLPVERTDRLEMRPHTEVLLVGVSDFDDTRVAKLPGAVDSVGLLRRLFVHDLSVPWTNVRTLVNEQATRDGVLRALRDLFIRTGWDGQAIVYLGTHASVADTTEGPIPYLVARDTQIDDPRRTGLQLIDLFHSIATHFRGYRVMVIMDVCQAGKMDARIHSYLTQEFSDSLDKVAIMLACGAEEQAVDLASLRSSVLTYCFAEGMRGAADENQDRTVTPAELGDYLSREVPRYTEGHQHPELRRRSAALWSDPLVYLKGAKKLPPPNWSDEGRLDIRCPIPGTRVFLDEKPVGEIGASRRLALQSPPGDRMLQAVFPSGSTIEMIVRVSPREELPVVLEPPPVPEGEPFGIVSDVLPVRSVAYQPVAQHQDDGIWVNPSFPVRPWAGRTCVEVGMDFRGDPDSNGVFWLPGGSFGDVEGADLSKWEGKGRVVLEFWARGRQGGEQIQAKVGGVRRGKYKDSLEFPVTTEWLRLEPDWRRYEIDLTGKDLSQVIDGFCVVSDRRHNGGREVVFYVDEATFRLYGQK